MVVRLEDIERLINVPYTPAYAQVSKVRSGFGGIVVSMLASGTQVRGFKPQEVTIPNKPDAILAADTARWHCQYFSV
jgi:hypothetical protein